MNERYFGCTLEKFLEEFAAKPDEVKDEEVIIAYISEPDYDMQARLLYQRNGKLYEVAGSHCSCYGFEGQWDPKEVTWDQLAMRNYMKRDYGGEATKRLVEIVNQHVPRA